MAKQMTGGLKLHKDSGWWYGRYKFKGKTREPNLRIQVKGTRPGSIRETGDATFERSRKEAQKKLNSIIAELNEPITREASAQAVHTARYGKRVETYLIDDLPELWKKAQRKSPVGEKRIKQNTAWINNFVSWCRKTHPTIQEVDFIDEAIAKEYMQTQADRGIAASTYNDIAAVLKMAFRQAKSKEFDCIVDKEGETTSRKPYSPEELRDILDAAQSDPFIRPLVTVAASSPLRKGDICMLRWMDDEEKLQVNFDTGILSVKTSKTGARITLPMNDMLYNELQRQVGNGSEYVFPRQAEQYRQNPKVITHKLKRVLAKAGFYDNKAPTLPRPLDDFDPQKLTKEVYAFIETVKPPTNAPDKQERMRKLFDLYISGKSVCKAAKSIGIAQSSASTYLNDIQTAVGTRFIRGANTRAKPDALPEKKGSSTLKPKSGVRRVSVRDWHGFRTTWITSQLCAGMSVQLIAKATGHASAKLIESNYFKPDEQMLKEAFGRYIPDLVKNSHGNPVDRAIERLSGITSGMTKAAITARAAEALELLTGKV